MITADKAWFKIEQGPELTDRGPYSKSEIQKQLAYAFERMDISTKHSVFVPVDKASSPASCSYHIDKAAEKVRKTVPALTKFAVRRQVMKDTEGKYLGTRVWRIA